MKSYRYSLTFERPERPDEPQMVTGHVQATSPATALARAYREAATKRRGRKWDDIVVILWQGAAADGGDDEART